MEFGLDIVTLAVLLLFAIIGAKRGFIKSCVNFFGALIAMVGAGFLSAPISEWIYTTFFHTSLVGKITTAIAGLSKAEAVESVFQDFPQVVQRALQAAGITQGSVMAQLQGNALDVAEGIAGALSPMLIGLIQVFAMVVLFILLLVVIRALASLISFIFELPVLRGLNSLLGAVFGVLMAVIAIWIVLACVQVFMPLFEPNIQVKIAQILGNSAFVDFFYQFNPAYWMIG